MSTFKALVNLISGNKLVEIKELKLYNLGTLVTPKSRLKADLREYFIDEDGDLYSLNKSSYVTKYGSILEQLSNNSLSRTGEIVNTFRDTMGRKATFKRKTLKKLMQDGNLRLVKDNALNY